MSRSLPTGSLIRLSCSALSNTDMLEHLGRQCQVLHLEPPLHEDAYESFLKIELEQAVNMASTKIYDILLFFDEWLYLDLFDLYLVEGLERGLILKLN
jgi:hypothetical protein